MTAVALALAVAAAPAAGFVALEDGLELALHDGPDGSAGGLAILRIEPARFELVLVAAAREDGRLLTARAYGDRHGLVAAGNPGIFPSDDARAHLAAAGRDRAFLAFAPRRPELPPWRLADASCPDLASLATGYGAAIESRAALSCAGPATGGRRASAAAIGVDRAGRLLLVHVRAPVATGELLALLAPRSLDLERLLVAEAGPEAQLWVRAGEVELERVGSFEAGTFESDENRTAWPLPAVLGVVRRPPPAR